MKSRHGIGALVLAAMGSMALLGASDEAALADLRTVGDEPGKRNAMPNYGHSKYMPHIGAKQRRKGAALLAKRAVK